MQEYRPDIDGLRAVAVMAVVLFHASGVVPGGFVGVDIFFVISGFLITRLLAAEIEAGRFSLLGFFDRRARRILPAFVLVTGVTLAAGVLFLVPSDYALMARSAVAAAGFFANVFFWLHTGYFDPAAHSMPLLHEWTLSVEEQFYLAWPMALYFLWRWRGPAIVALVAIGIAGSIALISIDQKAAFFLAPPRAWEFLLGAALVAYPRLVARHAEAAATLGAALIAYSFFGLTGRDVFPGWNALYPCFGAALVIAAGPATRIARVLSSPRAVFVGKISYSFYLWHWPVLVYYRQYQMREALTPLEVAALLAVIAGLSYLSWRYVERPVRARRGWKISLPFAGVGVATIAACAAFVVVHDGFVSRIPKSAPEMRSDAVMWAWQCPQMVAVDSHSDTKYCVFGAPWDKAATHGILWGDSHAGHYAPLMDLVGRQTNTSFVLAYGCPPMVDNVNIRILMRDPNKSTACAKERNDFLRMLEDVPSIKLVVLAMRWNGYELAFYHRSVRDRSEEEGRRLLKIGLNILLSRLRDRTVVLLGQVPPTIFDLHGCILRSRAFLLRRPCNADWVSESAAQALIVPDENILRQVAAENGVRYIPVIDKMCHAGRCNTYLNGEFLYRDDHHLRRNLQPETLAALARTLELQRVFRPATKTDVAQP